MGVMRCREWGHWGSLRDRGSRWYKGCWRRSKDGLWNKQTNIQGLTGVGWWCSLSSSLSSWYLSLRVSFITEGLIRLRPHRLCCREMTGRGYRRIRCRIRGWPDRRVAARGRFAGGCGGFARWLAYYLQFFIKSKFMQDLTAKKS